MLCVLNALVIELRGEEERKQRSKKIMVGIPFVYRDEYSIDGVEYSV